MEGKTADFDPAILEDRYRTALVEILRAKKRETPLAEGPVQPSAQNVINLMDALRRSMDRSGPRRRSRRHDAPPANRPGARRVHAVEAPTDMPRIAKAGGGH